MNKAFSLIVIGVIGFMLFISFSTPKPHCIDGEKDIFLSYECKKGNWVHYDFSEKDKAIEAKKVKAEYEVRLKEQENFCGKGNVNENFRRTLPCIDYSLVPDENLK